jgi:predicted O-linked N-acetylglucosamine transferase (SPINDLY family)
MTMNGRDLDMVMRKAKSAFKRGDLSEAERLYASVLARFPMNPGARAAMAALRLDRAGNSDPAAAAEHTNRGFTLLQQGRIEDAKASFEQAIRTNVHTAEAHVGMGMVNKSSGRLGQAIASYEQAITIRPAFAEAHYNLGLACLQIGRTVQAADCFERSIAINPNLAVAHNSLGAAHMAMGQPEVAIRCYERALALRPDFADALTNLGTAMQSRGRTVEAIDWFGRALAINPDDEIARSQRLMQQAQICDWAAISDDAAWIAALGMTGRPCSPFATMTLEDNPARQRTRAEHFAKREYPRVAGLDFDHRPQRPQRLKLAYFSAEFHDHATMFLVARLFELHDRGRFEIHLFSYGPDRDDAMRRRAKAAADQFHDVRSMSDRDIAALARRERIDIAIDLKGYTQNNRLGIHAWRPAPVQVSYLGFPGTLGTRFIDYIIADRIVIPDSQREHYSERIIYLPDSYQANDDTRPIPACRPTRQGEGLPDDGFVFCSFNNSYKITKDVFEIWMRLLRGVPGSVLWLLGANQWAQANLKRHAVDHGVDPRRIIFAPRVPHAAHLARHSLADLFLDTFTVNAHTTASDALWAGLPLVTKTGSAFAARVASSLLNGVGLTELIADSAEDYERIVLELASDPVRLQRITTKLMDRSRSPVFDSALFTRHLERGLDEAFAHHLLGLEPTDIRVKA